MTLPIPIVIATAVIILALLLWVFMLYYRIKRHLNHLHRLNTRFLKAYSLSIKAYRRTRLPLFKQTADIFANLYFNYSDTIRTF